MVECTKQIVLAFYKAYVDKRTGLAFLSAMLMLFSTASYAERIIGGCPASAPPIRTDFQMPRGEKLEYDISFFGLKTGQAKFTTSDTPAKFWVKAKGRLRLNSFFHWIDDVDGRMVSYLRPLDGRPGRMFNQVTSGKDNELRESAVFSGKNDVKGTLLYKGRKKPAKLQGTSDVLDSLSVLYYLRSRKLVPGAPFCFEVYHRRRLWRIEGQMLKKTPFTKGPVRGEALLVEATFRRLGGGKSGAKPNVVRTWLSADRQQLPLRLTSALGFGDLEVDLKRYRISKASK